MEYIGQLWTIEMIYSNNKSRTELGSPDKYINNKPIFLVYTFFCINRGTHPGHGIESNVY